MVTLPLNVHLLHSVHQSDTHLGTSHRNNSYIVAFVQSKDVLHVSREITENVRIDLGKYKAKRNHKVVDTREGKEVLIYFEEPHLINISKESSPMVDWYIESASAEHLLALPIIKNIGLIMPYKQVDENKEQMTFESYIIDPVWNPHLFRNGLDAI